MASVGDLVTAVKRVGAFEIGKRVYHQMADDSLLVWAAAMAYSWLFAIFPFFIFLLTLLPYLPPQMKMRAAEQIEIQLREYFPQQSFEAIWANVSNVLNRPRQGLLGVGIFLTLWAASGGMAMTNAAVQRCYEIMRGRPYYKARPLAIGMTIIVATLIVLVLILLPVSSALVAWAGKRSFPLKWIVEATRWIIAVGLGVPILLAGHYIGKHGQYYKLVLAGTTLVMAVLLVLVLAPVSDLVMVWMERTWGFSAGERLSLREDVPFLIWIFNSVRWALALLLMLMVVAVIYYFGPGVRQHFRIFTPGSVFVIIVWVVMGVVFKAYIERIGAAAYDRTYGTVGGVAILLLLFYIDALVLLLGAEINSEVDFEVTGLPRGTRDFRVQPI